MSLVVQMVLLADQAVEAVPAVVLVKEWVLLHPVGKDMLVAMQP